MMMNSVMLMAVVPFGWSQKVLESARSAGARGGTIFRARGASREAKEGMLHFHVEPEEEVVLILAAPDTAEAVCSQLNRDFKPDTIPGGALYLLPVQSIGASLGEKTEEE
jgi:hypothetical protein